MKKLTLLILLIAFAGCLESLKDFNQSYTYSSQSVLVIKVIDGDTIDILNNGKIEKIRLVGIDTPEPYSDNNSKKWYGLPNNHLKEWGLKAKDYTKNRLLNKEVNISYDSIQGKEDDYGRTLAYVLIDGKNFNLELVENGYARVYTEKKSDLYIKLMEAQTRAQLYRIGLWDYNDKK